MLTREQRERYQRDGYIVLPGFKSLDAIARLRERACEIVVAFDPDESRPIFTTRDQARASDAWFLGSPTRCTWTRKASPARRAGIT